MEPLKDEASPVFWKKRTRNISTIHQDNTETNLGAISQIELTYKKTTQQVSEASDTFWKA